MNQAALNKMNYGLYVTGVPDEKWFGGCIVDAFMQVTLEPATVIYSAMAKNRTTELLKEETDFSVSVLPADVHPFLISNFGFQSARAADKWKNVPHEVEDRLPYLRDAAAWYRCRVRDLRDLGSHILFFCDVLEAREGEKESLVYADYRKSMKPLAVQSFTEFKKTGISPLL